MLFYDLISKWLFQLILFTGYVNSADAFPPALSSEEENKYIRLYKDGDSDARKILIERNLRLVAHIAKKYGDENTLNDYISIGTIGLIKGIDTFDCSPKRRLSPYVSRCIENEILMTLRKNKKRQNEVSIDDTIGVDKEGNTLSIADILPTDTEDVADGICREIDIIKLKKAINEVLTPGEIMIICKRYGLGGSEKFTQQEIADKLGISRSYVSRIEKKCLKKLGEVLNT